MGMTRRERFERQRDRERIKKIGGEGIKIEAAPETRCDICGEPVGTLYEIDGKLICYASLPFEWQGGSKAIKLLNRAVSGLKAIKDKRRAMAA